jgi:hypothetical protein
MILFLFLFLINIFLLLYVNKVIERLPIAPDTQAFKNKKEELT